ncbi:MAG TPA: glycoside hydrolase family 13 protein [Mycobacteriales bacterium]|nr:glycoside hydrolase family 13 protein [Mycobacteriales bacterium]
MSNREWWRSAVIYQVYLRSFVDGSGDGLGDIAGIRSRLPYLADLGIDAIWINPWYPSPQVDAGYDVADYRDVEPAFGTLADAEALLAECREHGIKVILDIVPNHTSDQHRWFREALATPSGSPERGRYVFRPGRGENGELPPTNWRAAFGGPAWERVEDGSWYLHLFAPEQPDLNWENPEVRAEFEDILRFWFDRGVAGFRIDVAHGLIKDPTFPDISDDPTEGPFNPGHPAWDQDPVHEIYRDWRRVADSYDEPRIFVSEAWVSPPERLARYVRSDELHTTFNFDFLRAPWDPKAMRAVIDDSTSMLADVGAPTTWVLSNHDVIRHLTRYGRAAGQENQPAGTVPTDLELGTRRARAAALLTLALPGGAYVYQGEELGLAEVEDLPVEALADPVWERSGHTSRGRDGCRVPLPWSGGEPPYGFSTGQPWLPQPKSWAALTAEVEAGEPGSMLELYRAALRIRRGQDGLGDGSLRWLDSAPNVLAFAREPGFCCVVNLSAGAVDLPPHSAILLTSGELVDGRLPSDHAAWLRTD